MRSDGIYDETIQSTSEYLYLLKYKQTVRVFLGESVFL